MSQPEDAAGSGSDEAPTQLVMRPEGSTILVWVVVDGKDVFHAAPHISMSKHAVYGAIRTFYSHAFSEFFPEIEEEEDDDNGLWGLFQ